jgi:hypothetical protein
MLWLQASPTRSMALNAVALGLLTHATEQKQPKGGRFQRQPPIADRSRRASLNPGSLGRTKHTVSRHHLHAAVRTGAPHERQGPYRGSTAAGSRQCGPIRATSGGSTEQNWYAADKSVSDHPTGRSFRMHRNARVRSLAAAVLSIGGGLRGDATIHDARLFVRPFGLGAFALRDPSGPDAPELIDAGERPQSTLS